MKTEIEWPEHCEKPAHPEIGEKKPCKEECYMAIVSKDGSSPPVFLCRNHGLEFMAIVSLESQKDIMLKGLGMVLK